jgi:hypothetical protein
MRFIIGYLIGSIWGAAPSLPKGRCPLETRKELFGKSSLTSKTFELPKAELSAEKTVEVSLHKGQ